MELIHSIQKYKQYEHFLFYSFATNYQDLYCQTTYNDNRNYTQTKLCSGDDGSEISQQITI